MNGEAVFRCLVVPPVVCWGPSETLAIMTLSGQLI